MSTKTALVTGANKGIGFEVARQLGQAGFQVIVAGRTESKVDRAVLLLREERLAVSPLYMDVAEPSRVQHAYQILQAQVKKLDVLVNNAAVLLDDSTPFLELETVDLIQTFQTNALGPFFVSQTFLPLLSKNSRIVNVSSGAGQICGGMGTWAPVYSSSKTALNALTIQMARALQPRGIAVNAVCPGWVRTEMGGSGASRSVEKGAETIVWLATEAAQGLTGKFWRDQKEISW
jgi:NAD(P)-dependent dehydrogenase (short-subunit alcohol dehydrogenase family)